ncbi:hypothetical protein EXIGLDRAFT_268172 [Exidia glandulosa HHB12029]|uniref:WAP domain-containing protein n=1 Tax=Exidia glandulosa HHB12029 TaxID=1314781 RepID=A0A165DPE0_EXIGL|nr:hypothetical protein EXIGLDRAFT_268172 [Exidia glandulosa HHB12029]
MATCVASAVGAARVYHNVAYKFHISPSFSDYGSGVPSTMVLPIKVALLLLPALACAAYTPQPANLNGRARRSSHSKNLTPTNGGNIDHPPPILAVGLPVQGPPPSNPTHPSNKATSPPNKPAPSSTKSTSPPDRSIPPSPSSSQPKQPKATTQKSAPPPTKSAPTSPPKQSTHSTSQPKSAPSSTKGSPIPSLPPPPEKPTHSAPAPTTPASRPTPPPKQSTHSPSQPKPAPSSTKGSPISNLPPRPVQPTHSAPAPTTGTTAQTTSTASSPATQTNTSFTTTTDVTTQTRARTRTHSRHPGTFVPAPSSLPAPTVAPGGGGGEERITFTQEFSVAFEELSVVTGPIPTDREGRLKHPPAGTFAMFPALPTNAGGGDWCFENSDCGSPNSICCEGQCISYAGDSGTCDTREDLKVDACAFDIDCPGFDIFGGLEGII